MKIFCANIMCLCCFRGEPWFFCVYKNTNTKVLANDDGGDGGGGLWWLWLWLWGAEEVEDMNEEGQCRFVG